MVVFILWCGDDGGIRGYLVGEDGINIISILSWNLNSETLAIGIVVSKQNGGVAVGGVEAVEGVGSHQQKERVGQGHLIFALLLGQNSKIDPAVVVVHNGIIIWGMRQSSMGIQFGMAIGQRLNMDSVPFLGKDLIFAASVCEIAHGIFLPHIVVVVEI